MTKRHQLSKSERKALAIQLQAHKSGLKVTTFGNLVRRIRRGRGQR